MLAQAMPQSVELESHSLPGSIVSRLSDRPVIQVPYLKPWNRKCPISEQLPRDRGCTNAASERALAIWRQHPVA